MTKFNVGDKVQFIENYMDHKVGDVVEVIGFWSHGIEFVGKHGKSSAYYKRFKLAESKPTKKQRITALENEVAELRPLKQEVAELKLIVHELRERPQLTTVINNAPQEPSTTNTVEDIIEFEGQQYRKVDREAREGDVVIFHVNDTNPEYSTVGKPYKVAEDFEDHVRFIGNNGGDYAVYTLVHNRRPETTDVYELIETKPLTPNQQRAEIILKAKEFVVENNSKIHPGNNERTTIRFIGNITDKLEFVINEEKRTVVALIKGVASGDLYAKGIAKCHPQEVFNEWIGKAIALGRALGLDVSEFEQAVQPSEVVVGQLVDFKSHGESFIYEITKVIGNQLYYKGGWFEADRAEFHPFADKPIILNDTNAKYEEGQE
ncbi:bZIP transcription factor [Lysinibacillus sp. NPDC096212]|uniref:bZIP transcription factor n=1 Tax=Lysinibacillus sp. NPDC096212 TaxID=3364135 RepID=UPI00382B2B1F